jgi:hypothetical protein
MSQTSPSINKIMTEETYDFNSEDQDVLKQIYNLETIEGTKYDKGKPQLSLLPTRALSEVAQVLTYGAQKYDAHNWRKGMAWSRLSDATLRHFFAFNDGIDVDKESGLLHLAHASCDILFLLEYYLKSIGTDDRYKGSTGE